MLWPYAKTLVPAEAGYEFFVEMLKPPFAKHLYSRYPLCCLRQQTRDCKHSVAFTTNFVPYIITPPLLKNFKNCTHRMTRIRRCPPIRSFGCTQGKRLYSGQAFFAQGRICSGTSFNNIIYTILATFPQGKSHVITHFFDKIM